MAEPYEYPDALVEGGVKGRGAGLNPGDRFESVRLHVLGEHLDEVLTEFDDKRQVKTRVFRDRSRTLINYVDPEASPDISFRWSINPYRGCEHGCVYCYARPGHEYLGLSSGLDFETKLLAKLDAPQLLRKELSSPRWRGETIAMSGVTDPYQPIESKLRIARGCLEVMAECRQPVGIVTKNRLITRDLDLLVELSRYQAAVVCVSVTTLDPKLARVMEPRASSPAERLKTIRKLSDAGVRTAVMFAPVIPGINDREMPAVLEASADHGATGAGYVLLRLPHQIKALFTDWLAKHFPDRRSHVESLLRQTHNGALYDARPGIRQRGEGPIAAQIAQMFKLYKRRFGLEGKVGSLSGAAFRPPRTDASGQMALF